MVLSESQIESFDENGFVVLDGFFSSTLTNEFRDALRKVIRASLRRGSRRRPGLNEDVAEGEELDDGINALEAVDHAFVADIYDTVYALPEFLRIVSEPKTPVAINQLLRKPIDAPLYTFTCRCRIDPPRDDRRTYGWHQETFYTLPETRFLQTWAPLVRDVTEQNGTIEVCAGSHKAGVPRQRWIEEPGRALQIIVDSTEVQKYKPVTMNMKLGQLLIFSNRTFHRSGNNTSDRVRYSLVGMYHDCDHETFRPAAVDFRYKGKTPRQWFDEHSWS